VIKFDFCVYRSSFYVGINLDWSLLPRLMDVQINYRCPCVFLGAYFLMHERYPRLWSIRFGSAMARNGPRSTKRRTII